LNSSGQLY